MVLMVVVVAKESVSIVLDVGCEEWREQMKGEAGRH